MRVNWWTNHFFKIW